MIKITCYTGEVFEVLAAKPKNAEEADSYLQIVLKKTHSGFVVHDINLYNGGCHNGRYYSGLAEALETFNKAN